MRGGKFDGYIDPEGKKSVVLLSSTSPDLLLPFWDLKDLLVNNLRILGQNTAALVIM